MLFEISIECPALIADCIVMNGEHRKDVLIKH